MKRNLRDSVSLDVRHEMFSLTNLVWRSYFVVDPGDSINVDYSRFCKGSSLLGDAKPVSHMDVYVTLADKNRHGYKVQLEPEQSSIKLDTATLQPNKLLIPDKEVVNLVDKFIAFQPDSQLEIILSVEDEDGDMDTYLMAIGYVNGRNLPGRFVLLNSVFSLSKAIFGFPLTVIRLLVFKKYD